MKEKEEARPIPVDLEGHVIPVLTEAQKIRKVELEYNRLMKTSNKLEWRNWTREEKHMMIQWAFGNNFDTSIAEFKHLVEMFKLVNKKRDHHIIRSTVAMGGGRCLDIWCMFCGRVHSFKVPLVKRGTWRIFFQCKINEDDAFETILDNTESKIWEIEMLNQMKNKNLEEVLDVEIL